MRPTIPSQFLATHGKLCKIMEDSWDKEPSKRPSFAVVIESLTPCLLGYSLNDDSTGITMWSRYFKDRTTVSIDEFITSLWKGVIGTKVPEPDDETFIYLKCVEAVIIPPGSYSEEVTLDRFGLFIHWYGPLLSSRGENVFHKLDSLLRAEWYHGELSAHAAEDLLRSKTAGGDYLIRCSLNHQAPFTMSRLVNNSLVHYRILYNRSSGVYKMQYQTRKKSNNEDTGEISGNSLSEFVRQSCKVLGLKSPIKCNKFQPLFQKQKTISVGYEIAFTNK